MIYFLLLLVTKLELFTLSSRKLIFAFAYAVWQWLMLGISCDAMQGKSDARCRRRWLRRRRCSRNWMSSDNSCQRWEECATCLALPVLYC